MGLGDAIEFAHMPLGLVPEILDAIDVRLPIREQLGVVDSVVPEGEDIQHVIRAKGVGINDAVRDDFILHNGSERLALHVRNHLRIDLATTLQQAKYRHFAGSSAASHALALASK